MKSIRMYVDAHILPRDINKTGGWAVILEHDSKTLELTDAESNADEVRLVLTGIVKGLQALKEPCDVNLLISCPTVSRYFALATAHKNEAPFTSITSRRNLDLWAKISRLADIHRISCSLLCGGAHPRTKELAFQSAHTKGTIQEVFALFGVN